MFSPWATAVPGWKREGTKGCWKRDRSEQGNPVRMGWNVAVQRRTREQPLPKNGYRHCLQQHLDQEDNP